MAGHSKWANIKHRKGKQDMKKARDNAKLVRAVYVASGFGSDPASNPMLRLAIANAKAANVPGDKLKDAINRKRDADAEDLMLEVFGPSGASLLVNVSTTSKNRFLQLIRPALDRHGGSLAKSGSTLKNFAKKSAVQLRAAEGASSSTVLEPEMQELAMETALEVEAEGVQESEQEEDTLEVLFGSMKEASAALPTLQARSEFKIGTLQDIMVATNRIDLSPTAASQMIKLLSELEDL